MVGSIVWGGGRLTDTTRPRELAAIVVVGACVTAEVVCLRTPCGWRLAASAKRVAQNPARSREPPECWIRVRSMTV
jgi:hypothetical protein